MTLQTISDLTKDVLQTRFRLAPCVPIHLRQRQDFSEHCVPWAIAGSKRSCHGAFRIAERSG